MDRDPIDVEVLQAEDGYAVKVTARSFVRDVTLLADRAAADATVDDAPVTLPPQGRARHPCSHQRSQSRNMSWGAHRYFGPPTTYSTPRALSNDGEIVVPAELAALHEKYSGEAGRVWIAGLPALAAAHLDRWELAIDGRVASGAVALIIPVACRDGSQGAQAAAG